MNKLAIFALLILCTSSLVCSREPESQTYRDFIFPESHERELIPNDFYSLGCWQPTLETLSIARNEIYARKGYIFESEQWNEYFGSKPWYKPISRDSTNLNRYEEFNVGLMRYYEHCLNRKSKYYRLKHDPPTYHRDEDVLCDLDGDGKQDTIRYTFSQRKYELTINGSTYHGRAECLVDSFAIVDIDINDGIKEVVVSALGPSDDPSSDFFIYRNDAVEIIGQTYSLYNDGIGFDGHRNLRVISRGSILETWFFEKLYILDEDHHLKTIEDNIYSAHHSLFLKQALTVYRDRDTESPTTILKPLQVVEIIATDDKRWCKIRTANVAGWFYVDKRGINGSGIAAYNMFYGLSYAD